MKINKSEIIQLFIQKMEEDIHQLEKSLKDIKAETTHEENKPENEYDTRAIESGYLAKGQSIRLLDAREALAAFKHTEIKTFTDDTPVSATAVIKTDHDGKIYWFLYMPAGGGYSIQYQGIKITVLTPKSPLGESILGLRVGDCAVIESDSSVKEYDLLEVY